MLPVPTVAYLAQFTTRPESSFTAHAEQALIQAALLLSLKTGLNDYPADEDQQLLAIHAILEMADKLYLEHPFKELNARPFSSETIGQYSYSRSATFQKALRGDDTGLLWWDLAIDLLTSDVSDIASDAISAFEFDGMYRDTSDGRRVLLSPADLITPDTPYFYNANRQP